MLLTSTSISCVFLLLDERVQELLPRGGRRHLEYLDPGLGHGRGEGLEELGQAVDLDGAAHHDGEAVLGAVREGGHGVQPLVRQADVEVGEVVQGEGAAHELGVDRGDLELNREFY